MHSKEYLAELFRYNPKTGLLLYRSNGKEAGSAVFNRIGTWYRRVIVDGMIIYTHRVAWLLATGSWPEKQIDHINGNGLDNRFSNLRDVTEEINRHNFHRRQPTMKALPVGVGHTKGRYHGAYSAKIRDGGRQVYLGRFDSAKEASEAYQKAKRKVMAKLLSIEDGAKEHGVKLPENVEERR